MEGARESRSTASTSASFLERIALMFDRLRDANALDRLRRGDASLWTSADEAQWLGWLDLPERSLRALPALEELVAAARSDGIDRVVVLGMGGSSLGAEALVRCGPRVALDAAELVLLDTTDPDRVADAEAALRGHQPLFVCSSKSGTTLETALLQAYWLERYDAASFVAVTDPGTRLETEARAKGFRAVLPGDPEVGGRFSVLSAFGLLPAALCGIGVREVLDAAVRARDSVFGGGSDGERRVEGLAALLGAAEATGRDKLTVLAPQHLRSFGWWLEQLLAESLGKNGRGVVPVLDEDNAPAARYRPDRAFLWLDDEGDPRSETERERLAEAGRELVAAGQPVERLPIDRRDLGGELYRWEVVTALAGHLLAVHPFDQPDVEAAKVATRRYVEALRRGEALPRAASVTAGAVQLSGYGDGTSEAEGAGGKVTPPSAADALAGLLAAARIPGSYVALLAYLPQSPELDRALGRIRGLLLDRLGVATCAGYGPRYLHSSGQLHKGGPPSGCFLLLTAERDPGPRVPGEPFGFREIQLAQALGDAEALAGRGRTVVRAHLHGDLPAALDALRSLLGDAIGRANHGPAG